MKAAFFDVDGTLVRSNAFRHYWDLLGRLGLGREGYLRRARALACGPYWWLLDRFDRSRFDASFHSVYRGLPAERVREAARAGVAEYLAPRLIPSAVRRAKEHASRGDRLVLVSGSLDVFVAPLAERLGAADVLCSAIVEEGGTLTGRLKGPSMSGAGKARAVAEFAAARGIDLSRCHAYADSWSDLPFLELVGRPTAVEPEARLRAVALRRGWEVL